MTTTVRGHRVVFTPSGLSGEIEHGTNVLAAARAFGVDLDSVCGGRGICGRCQVSLPSGTFPKWGITSTVESVSPPSDAELDYQGARPLAPGHRLGCATCIHGDVVVDVPAVSQVHRQVVRKELELLGLSIDPAFSLLYIELPAASAEPTAGLTRQVRTAVAHQHGRAAPAVAHRAIPMIQEVWRKGAGACTVAIDATDAVVAAWPGFVDEGLGVAIDVGSTTLAGHLCGLAGGDLLASAGRMNPQIRLGEDLMSRVSYVMMNPGGREQLTAVVRSALDELVGELIERAGTSRDRVLEVVLVGNPIMHHLVLGLDPTSLGQAPFTLATAEAVTTLATELGLGLPAARCYVGPCVAGHVGADTVAAVLSEAPHRAATTTLVVDVGTNAEIVLGNRGGLYAASSPTGPAFEGAQLSAGQRATVGAIEGVRIDRDSYDPRCKVVGIEPWSDDPGFAAAAVASGITGLCGSGIIDAIAEMFLAGIIDRDGVIDGSLSVRTSRVVADGRTFRYVLWAEGGDEIAITQNDVRAVQLAKAALRAGIDLLVERAGCPDIDEIRLTGAFGAHIDPVRAMVLGLVPDHPPGAVTSVGNAAGKGAVQALLSRSARTEMEELAERIVKVETATEPRFQELFVAAMALPHATATSDHLAQVVSLPVGAPSGSLSRRRRRTRGRSPS